MEIIYVLLSKSIYYIGVIITGFLILYFIFPEHLKKIKQIFFRFFRVKKKKVENKTVPLGVLKYDYHFVYNIIDDMIENNSGTHEYLIKLDKYFSEEVETEYNSLEFLACLYRALNEVPVFKLNEDSYYINSRFNNEVLKNISQKMKFNLCLGRVVNSRNRKKISQICYKRFLKTDKENYFVMHKLLENNNVII